MADCPLCPRLVALRRELRAREPAWQNAPVVDFGPRSARLLIAGLAPGLRGANRTGRAFTGDDAGRMLFATLAQFGFCKGVYDARPDDGVELIDCLVANVVRCVPPGNRPLPTEIAACRRFFLATIERMSELRGIVALGRVAHESVLRALSIKLRDHPFAHGAEHRLSSNELKRDLFLIDSYHCSRLNANTGTLTPEMFCAIFARARELLDRPSSNERLGPDDRR
ncbi:MAG: uracil-DNA glycosylase [Methylocystis sp.]